MFFLQLLVWKVHPLKCLLKLIVQKIWQVEKNILNKTKTRLAINSKYKHSNVILCHWCNIHRSIHVDL